MFKALNNTQMRQKRIEEKEEIKKLKEDNENIKRLIYKLSIEDKLKMLSTYQNITSNIAIINLKKNTDYKKYLKIIQEMKNLNIKYGSINYDN